MNNQLSNDRLVFYSKLRRDPLVKELNAENTIRSVRNLIMSYFNLVNMAILSYKNVVLDELGDEDNLIEIAKSMGIADIDEERLIEEKEETYSKAIKIIEISCQPYKINSEDINSIAYHAGIDLVKRNGRSRRAKRKHPLEDRIREIESDYRAMLKTCTFRRDYFDDDSNYYLKLLSHPNLTESSTIKSVKAIIKNSLGYLNRSYALLRLADSEEVLIAYRETEYLRSNNLLDEEDNDVSLIDFENSGILTEDKIKKGSSLLRKQAKINELRFKQLYSFIWNGSKQEDPERLVEETYQKTFESYKDSKWFELSPEDVISFIEKTLSKYATLQIS